LACMDNTFTIFPLGRLEHGYAKDDTLPCSPAETRARIALAKQRSERKRAAKARSEAKAKAKADQKSTHKHSSFRTNIAKIKEKFHIH